MRELRNTKIIAVDHGYGNMKTANTVTPTGIKAYESINSPWARRFTLDPMGLAALNPPMGSSPLRVGRCFCGVTAKVATGDPHPLTPTGRCTPVPSTKGLQPSVLPPEKADCQKHSQSALPVFEESSIVAFFKKKNRCISLLRKTHRFFAQTFIA